MQGVSWVVAGWLVFGGSHLLLATLPVRRRLVARLGESGFVSMFIVLASVSFAALVASYAHVRKGGPPGLPLAAMPAVRAVLMTAMLVGFAFMGGSFAPTGYSDSPAAILREGVRPARGLERVTRHPFFTGLVLVMAAHALLATRLTGTVFFTGFVLLATLGPLHQAKKLRARKGEAYAQYLASTSAIPLVAILAGRQPLALGELPWKALVLGAAVGLGLREVHDWLLVWHGAPVILIFVGGSLLIGVVTNWRERIARRKERDHGTATERHRA